MLSSALWGVTIAWVLGHWVGIRVFDCFGVPTAAVLASLDAICDWTARLLCELLSPRASLQSLHNGVVIPDASGFVDCSGLQECENHTGD